MSKYTKTELQKLDVAEVAKRVRREIAAQVKSGKLPAIKTTVRVHRFAGGQKLNVEVTQVPQGFPVANRARVEHEYRHPREPSHLDMLSTEARLLLKAIEQIVAPYHWDRSDIQTDYWCCNFYLSISIDGSLRVAQEDAIRDALGEAAIALAQGEPRMPVLRVDERVKAELTQAEAETDSETGSYTVVVTWSESSLPELADGSVFDSFEAFDRAAQSQQETMRLNVGGYYCKIEFEVRTGGELGSYKGRYDVLRDEGPASLSKRMRAYLDNVLRFERERGEAEPVWRLSDKERAWVNSWLGWLDAIEQRETAKPVLRLVQGGAQNVVLPTLSNDGAAIARLLADAARAIRERDVFDAGWYLGLAYRGAFALSDAGESARALGMVNTLQIIARKTLRTCDRPAAERQLALFGRG